MGSRIENGIHILRTKMKVKRKEMIQDLNLQNRKKRREEAVDEVVFTTSCWQVDVKMNGTFVSRNGQLDGQNS